MSGLQFPKPRPAALERKDRRTARKSKDEAENKKVRARSGGLCEVAAPRMSAHGAFARCVRRATQVHHMIGGWGKRARGNSILAEHKQHVCADCHGNINGHVLQRIGGAVPQWTDYYRRVR